MTNKQKSDNKSIKKEEAVKDKCALNSGEYCGKCFAKLLTTVLLTVIVTTSIIITTPLWMSKVLPAEKQPAFLRKALMPVTNVKVVRTDPLPNNFKKMIAEKDDELREDLDTFKSEVVSYYDDQNKKIDTIDREVKKISNNNRYIDQNWKNKSIQHKMFLVSFYNMYNKASIGVPYAHDLDLMLLNLEPQMKIHKDLPWLIAYKNNPPRSLKAFERWVGNNYSKIVAENIKMQEKGLTQKIAIAFNSMFKIEPPVSKLPKGSLKYNLAQFKMAAENNRHCQAMKYGESIAKQSPWFKENVLMELKARWKINKQLKTIKTNVEQEIYKDKIGNMKNNKDEEKIEKYFHSPIENIKEEIK